MFTLPLTEVPVNKLTVNIVFALPLAEVHVNKLSVNIVFALPFTEVSEDLVKMLQERHELKEQVDMRKIAIEQLVRFQANTTQYTCDNIRDVISTGDQ